MAAPTPLMALPCPQPGFTSLKKSRPCGLSSAIKTGLGMLRSIRGDDRRNDEGEGASAPLAFRRGPDPPTVKLHQAPAEGQAQPASLIALRIGRFQLLELLEQALEVVRADADARVLHRNLDAVMRFRCSRFQVPGSRLSDSGHGSGTRNPELGTRNAAGRDRDLAAV